MRLAIVHDYLNQFGGAERVVAALHDIFPDAPVYTSVYDANRLPQIFTKLDIRVSFMQKLPFVFDLYRQYLFLYPFAFDAFDLSGYDVILSSSSAWAKGIRKTKEQLHICYCHSPMRFVWRYDDYIKKEAIPKFIKQLLPYGFAPLKYWDVETAKSVDHFIANSNNVANRIRQTYGREAVVIHPPVDCSLFDVSLIDKDYFVIVSRLSAYKRLDIVIKAFNVLELPLKIIGKGPAYKSLKEISGPYIEFLDEVGDESLSKILGEARALIFPGEEDFGITPLESMACGRPVIAYRAGGSLESIIENETGIFFDKQTPEALIKALQKFQFMVFDKNKIRLHAKKFDKSVFIDKIRQYIEKCYKERHL